MKYPKADGVTKMNRKSPVGLLIYPPSRSFDNNVPPLGLLAIASYVNARLGYSAVLVANLARLTPTEAKAELLRLNVRHFLVIGMTAMSTDVEETLSLAAVIRTMAPKATLVVGGPHATLQPDSFTVNSPVFDRVVLGEGEQPFLELVKECLEPEVGQGDIEGVIRTHSPRLNQNQAPVSTPIDDWANPFLAPVVFQPENALRYTTPEGKQRTAVSMVTSRSCPLSCHFCSIVASGAKYRTMSPDEAGDWLVEERKSHNFEHVYFLDADFLVSRARARGWSEMISARLPGVTWSVQANVGHVLALKDLLPMLRRRGLVAAELGIEAGNDRQLNFFNKTNFGKPATVEQSLGAIEALRDAGIAIGIDYIMFYPELTLRELAENVTFILKSGLIDSYDLGHYSNELMLFPGTRLRTYYEEKRGARFDKLQLPDVVEFYTDPATLAVRNAFLGEYVPAISPETGRLRRLLRAAAQRDLETASRLRLTELHLRHQPYHVLKRLLQAPQHPNRAVEWAKEDNRFAARVIAEARR